MVFCDEFVNALVVVAVAMGWEGGCGRGSGFVYLRANKRVCVVISVWEIFL